MGDSQPLDPDRQAIELARSGAAAAVESLVAKYQQRVFRLAMRIVGRRDDADEVVQQTFLSLVEHLRDFRGQSAFATWLLRIATNHGLSVLRRRVTRPAVAWTDRTEGNDGKDVPLSDLVARWRETPEQIAQHQELRQLLTETLDRLDLKYAMVFVLRDLEGLSTRETAEVLDIRPGTVKVRLLRARRLLRLRLAEQFGDETARIVPTDQET
ncbi:MAG: sigma-70 family RNA polymerase sigma factor [Pirellulales bacterium]|nr:sigma-70 family RNA polymerase sigma factor [Pirellulales bacterium]